MGELRNIFEKKDKEPEVINMGKFIYLLQTVTSVLNTVTGNIRGTIYQGYYKLVTGYTDQEIIGYINNPEEEQIKIKPLFFSALIDIARERNLAPKTEKKE